jgi:hypothetical protein
VPRTEHPLGTPCAEDDIVERLDEQQIGRTVGGPQLKKRLRFLGVGRVDRQQ